MRWFLILLLSVSWMKAQVFTDFYCDASVSANNTNVNAGSTTGGPVYGPSVNGNWDGTSVFTPTDGSTPASTVSAGMWASVYLDAATVAVYIAQVTNVAAGANGAITLSQAAFMGSKPASGVNGRTIRVGGCWKGPFGSVGFPFGFVAQTATNNTGYTTFVNFKDSAPYVISSALSHGLVGPIIFSGYHTNPRDKNRFTIDGNGLTATVLSFVTQSGRIIQDCIITNSASSGSGSGLILATADKAMRVLCVGMRGTGLSLSGSSGVETIECAALDCGKANGAQGGFSLAGNATAIRCFSSNVTAKAAGFIIAGTGGTLDRCIAAYNGTNGVTVSGASSFTIRNSDLFRNGGSGIEQNSSTLCLHTIENVNIFSNTVCAISNAATLCTGWIQNVNFGGNGTANGGDIIFNQGGILTNNITLYPSTTPWVNPTALDFRITGAAKSAGAGTFPASISSTIGYPDIGAAQGSDTNAAVSGGSWTFAQ